MRIEGRWHLFKDGILRPVIDAATNNFDVIYSHPKREVLLLAPPHSYEIQLRP